MKHKIFTVHDAAANAYIAPFFLPEEKQALRGFRGAINNPEHAFGQWPKDYTLMCIGEWDDDSGEITPYQTMKPLGNGLSFLQTETNPDQLQLLKEVNQS